MNVTTIADEATAPVIPTPESEPLRAWDRRVELLKIGTKNPHKFVTAYVNYYKPCAYCVTGGYFLNVAPSVEKGDGFSTTSHGSTLDLFLEKSARYNENTLLKVAASVKSRTGFRKMMEEVGDCSRLTLEGTWRE